MRNIELKKTAILIGPPGSGKSSIAQSLIETGTIAVIGTGKLFRREAQQNTDMGREINSLLEKGMFVPTAIVTEIVSSEILKITKEIIFFDGYPRVMEQVEAFLKICEEQNLVLHSVFLVDIPAELSIKRLTGRRVCSKCGEIYNIYFNPPPGESKCRCGGKLEIRDDDKPEVIEKRLAVYEQETVPLLNFFEEKYSDKFIRLNGSNPVNLISSEILKHLH